MNFTPGSISSPARERLVRFEGYLAEDPANALLLADACDAALAAGDTVRGAGHVRKAQALGLDPASWTRREARLCIAGREIQRAALLLDRLRASSPAEPALDHDRAWVHFLAVEYDACRALLTPWLQASVVQAVPSDALESLQSLWIRAGHHGRRVAETSDWIRQQQAAGALTPVAQGVASLLMIDADDFVAARSLADSALRHDPHHAEALVARGYVALAERDGARAEQMLKLALSDRQDDGRIWSALGFSSLQAQDLARAQVRFERALRTMPTHVGTWHGLGWTRLLRRDQAGAVAAFRQALALDGNFAESHGALGLVLAGSDPAVAEHHLRIADRLDPGNATGRFARALLRGEIRDRAQLHAIAHRLLDRPGFFGGGLAEHMVAATGRS